jgi:hypothetical protein
MNITVQLIEKAKKAAKERSPFADERIHKN